MKKIFALIIGLVVCVWMPMSFAQEDGSTLENNQKQTGEQGVEQSKEDLINQRVEEKIDEVKDGTKEIEKTLTEEDSKQVEIEDIEESEQPKKTLVEMEESGEEPEQGVKELEELEKTIDETKEVEKKQVQEIIEESIFYTVEFVIDGFEEKIMIEEKSMLEKPQDPIKEGHQFVNWIDYETEEVFDFSKEIISDHTLIASFEEIPLQRVLSEKGVRVEGLFLEDENLSVVVRINEQGGWIYSLKIVDKRGQESPLRTDTLVSIQLQDGVQAEDMQLQYENENYPATMSGSTISFTTDHFSDWSVLPKEARIEAQMIYPIKKYYGARKLKANTYPNNLGIDDWWWMDQINKFYVDGEIAFCVQPGVSISNRNAQFISANEYVAQSMGDQAAFDLMKTNRIIYYGWENSSHSDLDYLVTQLMVWQDGIGNIVEYKDFTFDDLSLEQYEARREEILKKVSRHVLLPSFDNDIVELQVNESITLTDKNDVLDQFEDFSAKGLKFERNGNKVTVTLLSEDGKNQRVVAKKKSDSYIGTPVISTDSEQDVILYRLQESLSTVLNVQGSSLAGIEIVKKEKNAQIPIKGAEFDLRDNSGNLIAHLITNEQGVAVANDLEFGEYTILETKVPSGYILDPTPIQVVADSSEKKIITVENEKVMGRLIIKKRYQDRDSLAVEGVKYLVFNEAGEEVDAIVTDQRGIAKSRDLPLGKYTIQEVEAPLGYQVDEKVYPIEFVYQDNQTKYVEIEKTLLNQVIQSEIHIFKYNKQNKNQPVVGAVFEVLDEKNQPALDVTGKEVGKIVTDQKGFAKTPLLRYGIYHVVEVQAPEQYYLNDEIFVAKIQELDKPVVIEISDEPVEASFEIIKKDADTKKMLAGAVFQILNEENEVIMDSLSVGKNGKFIGNQKLPFGKYILREIAAPSGYLLAKDLIFEVSKQTLKQGSHLELEVENEATYVEISKQSMGAEEVIGAKLQVFDEAGNLIHEWTSTNEPHMIKGLIPGKYVLHENLAPIGYQYAQDLPFEVLEKGGIQSFVVIDQPTEITIQKVDDQGNSLPGATLQIISLDGNIVKEWVSTTQAKVLKNLEAGEYILRETKAPNGYLVAKDQLFVISNTSQSEDVTMINQKIEVKKEKNLQRKLPKTGSKLMDPVWMLAGILFLLFQRVLAQQSMTKF